MDKYNVTIKPVKSSEAFASILNELSDYLESDELAPEHWDYEKLVIFYSAMSDNLTYKSKCMISKLYDFC